MSFGWIREACGLDNETAVEAIYQDWTIKINLFDIVFGHTAIVIIVQTPLISTASYLAGRKSSCGEMARQRNDLRDQCRYRDILVIEGFHA